MNAQQAQERADEAARKLETADEQNRAQLERERAQAAHEEVIAKLHEKLQEGKQ